MPRNDNQFLSPPAHLPTPLPEVPLHAPEPLAASSGLDHLIDFDPNERHDFSPPFREAQLPDEREETPPPLPIPPRIHADYHQQKDEDVETLGHTRAPKLPRSPTRLESLSRTIRTYTPSASVIRNYVPSSIQYIPVPSAIPSPPMVSRPLSYGRFSVDPEVSRQESASYHYDHSTSFGYHHHHHHQHQHHEAVVPTPSGVARALSTTTTPESIATYPSIRAATARLSEKNKDTHADIITWAHWDILSHRRVLIIAYTTGIQIWDCHELGSVTETLNLTLGSEEWEMDVASGMVRFDRFVWAGVLPPIHDDDSGDLLASHRPLLGFLLSSSTSIQHSAFFIYSLKNHQIVQRIALPGFASTFESNQNFIVITTISPPTVHILSALSFHTLWTISSASLATSLMTTTTNQTVSYLSSLPSSLHTTPLDQPPNPSPTPVIALSGRLLAYASPSPRQSRRISSASSTGSGPSVPNVSSPSPFRGRNVGPGLVQSEIGNAAIKVGGSVLSGMKFLGGIAYEAAKNKIAEAASTSGSMNVSSPVVGRTRFFSRSAPTDERPFSPITPSTSTPIEDQEKDKIVTPHTNPVVESGYHVTVLDLKPLLEHPIDGKPVKVAEFMTSRSQPVARLSFSRDGCKLISVPENGQVTRVFALRPLQRNTTEGGLGDDGEEGKVGDGVRMYDLRRGRTSGVVEGLDCARDGRWVAVGTKNRTVHVFPINPFGGRPDVVGHLTGKVRNVDELQPHLVEVAPLVRLRPASSVKFDHQQPSAPLAFTFINADDIHIPTNLLPHQSSRYTTSPTAADPASLSPTSPHRLRSAGNVQDVLVFDPVDGMLSLRRITTDQRPKDQLTGLAAAAAGVGGVVSRSLPGTSVGSPVTTRISVSPGSMSRASSTSTSAAAAGVGENRGASGVHGQGYGQEAIMELMGRSEVMATWDLQRKRDWEVVRKVVRGERTEKILQLSKKFGTDWLAQAELSTCSRSPRILPRSLYLSHQFTFWTFGEDYHALLRQYQFDTRGSKIHVRREVQVNIGVGLNNTSDRFVEDTSSLDFHRHQHLGGAGTGSASTSLDDPLASALAGDLVTDYHSAYANSVPPILPAYPNGGGGGGSYSLSSKTPAFIRNSIPIRKLGDGMSGGLGRIRKEISSSYYHRNGTGGTVQSPSLGPRREGEAEGIISVPLEFDEEDEDFLGIAVDTEGAPVNDMEIININHVGTAGISIGTSTGISAESRSGLTTGTSADTSGTSAINVVLPSTPEGGNEDLWKGWESREVGQTVEEMERFDDISVVGFLDEEHQKEKEVARERERERATTTTMMGQGNATAGVRVKKGKKAKGRKGGGYST